jgi:hypothetical protein
VVFKPTLGWLDNNNSSLVEYINTKVVGQFKPNEFSSYWTMARHLIKRFGRHVTLLTISIVLSLSITIVGICIFLKRCCSCCCSKPKPSLFDSKHDSCRRRVTALVLFLLLLVSLLATIVLFFANQNMHVVVAASGPQAFKTTLRQMRAFLDWDVAQFVNSTHRQIDMIEVNVSQLFDETLMAWVKDKAPPVKQFLVEFNATLAPNLKELSESSNRIVPYLTAVEGFAKIMDNAEINELVANLRSDQVLNEMLNSTSLLNVNTLLASLSNSSSLWHAEKEEIMRGLVRPALTSIQAGVRSVSETLQSTGRAQLHVLLLQSSTTAAKFNFARLVKTYYGYFYHFIMAISCLVLGIFVLHSCGLAGMCARRKHLNYAQCCHRGIHARLLIGAASLYFLFAGSLIIVCIGLYLPGIALRQFACKPFIDLESSSIFNLLKAQPEIRLVVNEFVKSQTSLETFDLARINFRGILSDCHLTNKSQQLSDLFLQNVNNKLKQYPVNITDLFKSSRLQDSLPEKMKSFAKSLNQIREVLNVDTFKRVQTGISKALSLTDKLLLLLLRDKSNEIATNNNIYIYNDTLNSLLAELTQMTRFIDTTKLTQATTLAELNSKLDSIETSLLNINNNNNNIPTFLTTYAQPKLDTALAERTQAIGQQLPSCHLVYSIYERVLLTGCLQYGDNLNTFWVTLLFLVLLHFVIACLALSQADLFRKKYAYNQLLESEMDDEPLDSYKEDNATGDGINEVQYQVFSAAAAAAVSKTTNSGGGGGGAPIDAYEMHGYTKNNKMSTTQIKTPPPNYKLTRA